MKVALFLGVILGVIQSHGRADFDQNTLSISSCIASEAGVQRDVIRRVQQLPKPKLPEGLEAQIQQKVRQDFKQEEEEIQGVKVPRVPEPTISVKIPQVSWSTQGRDVLLCKSDQQFILALVLKEKVAEFLKGGASATGTQVMLYGPASRPVVIVHE